MDTSDFLPIAVIALEALESRDRDLKLRAIRELTDFIESADKERAENNTRSNYRAHLKEGENL
jgi:hypothetical protein